MTEDDVSKLERQIDMSIRRADDVASGRPGRRRPWLIALSVLLVIALGAASALAVYLWRTTDEWRAEAERVTTIANGLAAERDTLAAELTQSQRDLEATDQQLREVQDRLLSLANEQAQTGDELEFTRLLAQDVATVGDQLEQCVDGQIQFQDELIVVLQDIEQFDVAAVAESARDFADEVNAFCDAAVQASDALQEQLDQ
jgi:septal ring factor EnvC (AmiA/AmiB activator)